MTESRKIAHAKGLYLEGIRDGNIREALDEYIGDRYIQHATGIADGKDGFLEYFSSFLRRYAVRRIRIVRSIVDGPYVFLHVHQILNDGQFSYVAADIFDTDENDKIIEHWNVVQNEVSDTVSGRSMTDGPIKIEDLDKTEENRELITGFVNVVLLDNQHDRAAEFISTEHYDQHNPTISDGLDGLYEHLKEYADQGIVASYAKAHKILVQGNFGAVLSSVTLGEEEWCYIDIFRFKAGKIVEHWDVQERVPPREQLKNSGKF